MQLSQFMLRNNATREFVVFGWIGKKSKKLKHSENSALTSFTGCADGWMKKKKTSMFKPVFSGAIEVYKPVNVGWLRLLENSFVHYRITAKGKNSAVGGFSYTEFSCNPSPTVFPIYNTQFMTV